MSVMSSKPTRNSIDQRNNERTPLIEYDTSQLDKTNEVESQMGVGWGGAAFLLVNTALGAGMLNYPYAYHQIGGVMSAALIQVILLVFVSSTMFILAYCADFNKDDTYHNVLLSMCGKRAQQISAVSILLTCYGICITFLVIIGDQYDRLFKSLLHDQIGAWYLDRKLTITLTAVLFIWPMCYARRLGFLRHASAIGMFAMLYVAFLTIYEHYILDDATIKTLLSKAEMEAKSSEHSQDSTIRTRAQWLNSLIVVPILCFAYQTHEVIVPVYACMEDRSIRKFMKASIVGLVILFFLYNTVGAYGYLTFGSRVGPDIMSLYDARDPVVVIGIVALVIKFVTTYLPLMFCGRGALDGLYGEIRKLSAEELKSSDNSRRIVITTIWFISTVLLAIFAPDISATLQLLGSMASINVFVFPGMCLIALTRRLRQTRLNALCDDLHNPLNEQRAHEYYVISGSRFGALRKSEANGWSRSHDRDQASSNDCHKNLNNCQYTATFANLIEFDKNSTDDDLVDNRNSANRAHLRHQRRQEEFDKLISDNLYNSHGGFQDHCLQDSWKNGSTTGSILDRLGSSMAPSIVAQIGISKCAALALYLSSILLISFGVFIFVLELVEFAGFI